VIFLAHGIGGIRDLPIPESYFFVTASVVLVVSFVLLVALWKRPQLERRAPGRGLPRLLSSVVLSRALRIALQAISVVVFVVVVVSAAFGTTIELSNLAPTFVYVIFWLGLPLLSVLLGNVWRALSPWRAIADAAVWVLELGGRPARPLYEYPPQLGRYPAAGALLAFVAMELAYTRPSAPRMLAIAIGLYTYWALGGMAVYGREAWTRGGEGFAVAFGLLARMAPFAVRDGRVVIRWPLTGLGGAEPTIGTVAFVAVMLGSTSFDGFSRTREWQNLIEHVRGKLVDQPVRVADLAVTLVNVAGLIAFVGVVALTYLLAVECARRLVRERRRLLPDFVLSLVPIAFAYVVAHYFSLFVEYGQFAILLASDPLGRGWNLFGTVGYQPNLTILTPNTVWYVQVGALVAGHVAGLAVAHDRAVALFPSRTDALRSQLPLLALMVLYTVGGLWVLSRG
jgi:hypothetical protein